MMDEAKTPSAAAKFDQQASDGIVYYGGSASRASGIPDANPAPFVGAAGLSSAQHAMMMSRLGDAEMMGEALNLGDEAPPGEPTGGGGGAARADEASGDDHLTPRRKAAIRRKSAVHKASKEGLLGEAALEHVQNRRGSMFNTEGIAIFGGPMLQRVRESARVPMSRGSAPWTGMPRELRRGGRPLVPAEELARAPLRPRCQGGRPRRAAGGGAAPPVAAARWRPQRAPRLGAPLGVLRHPRRRPAHRAPRRARRHREPDDRDCEAPKVGARVGGHAGPPFRGAGLPSKFLQMIEMRSMPDARVAGEEGPPPPRSRDPSRPPSPRASPAFHGAAGLTSDEVADRKGLLGFKEGQRRPMVGGHEAGDVARQGRLARRRADRRPRGSAAARRRRGLRGRGAPHLRDPGSLPVVLRRRRRSDLERSGGLSRPRIGAGACCRLAAPAGGDRRDPSRGGRRASAPRPDGPPERVWRRRWRPLRPRRDAVAVLRVAKVRTAVTGRLAARAKTADRRGHLRIPTLAARAAPGLAEAGISTRDGATPHVATAGVAA